LRGFRSSLAGLIAIGALLALVPGLVNFVGRARTEFMWDGVSVSNGALLALTEAIAMPTMLFGMAVIAEMLFRIAEISPVGGSSRVVVPVKRWRHPLVLVLLVGTALSFVFGLMGLYSFLVSDELGLSLDQRLGAVVPHLVQVVLTSAEIAALAAIVEYLSRISAKRTTE